MLTLTGIKIYHTEFLAWPGKYRLDVSYADVKLKTGFQGSVFFCSGTYGTFSPLPLWTTLRHPDSLTMFSFYVKDLAGK